MALHIRDDRAAKLARRLAERKGISMTEAVIEALESALLRVSGRCRSGSPKSPPTLGAWAIRAAGGR
jgi:antitoxin VapB